MSLYDELRRKHGSFIYHSYEFTEQDGSTLLRFHFSIDEYHFYPGWTFPEKFSGLTFDRELAERIAFSLGMAELVSYWKCACPPVVEIRCGGLSEEQKLWWKKLYFNGLGEFFYRNSGAGSSDSGRTEEYRMFTLRICKTTPDIEFAIVGDRHSVGKICCDTFNSSGISR